MTKRSYTPRVPGIACPHCGARSIARGSVEIDILTRELRFMCDNVDCGHTFVAQLAIYRTVRPSMTPNPSVILPLGEWRSRPANDDQRVPVNDNETPAAETAPTPG
ncbi:ogr/Delta-like zinc finger family protein [Sphingomonas pseudosanguinis]|uniref:DNA-directed RNA polymerase subunit RPC12/RpoP n=1 Tax=Sphingomonas pseudosanguinis TaxID=413712 RepID=A0A7W6A694_9SPHN|nr:DNA-directed RNA polymerase subunit RPC12/RpoP [Sphingomonas pseudosanguinis]MBN3537796.1 ogr/Delta-like zinc finger family protein [Sphingomonas pseudosanguinis]